MGGADIAPSWLLRVDPDGSVTRVAEDLWFANGSVITDDGVLIVDETFGNRVSAFDIEPDGSLANRRNWGHVRRTAGRAGPGRRLAGPGRCRGRVRARR